MTARSGSDPTPYDDRLQRILNASPAFHQVGCIVRATHERWDGTGYPDGLAGEQIPLPARVIAVCDAYSAITAERPYQASRAPAEAVAELRRCAGTHFDPAVVDAFARVHIELMAFAAAG